MCRGSRLWILVVACIAAAACGRSGAPFDPAGGDPSIPFPDLPGPGAPDLTFGTGADGVAIVGTNVNLTLDTLVDGRTCADAPWYPVTALSGTVAALAIAPGECLVPGDEVLLMNVRGATLSTANTGVFESLRIAAISGSSATFTSTKRFFYGAGVEDDDGIGLGAGEQRVVLQRVPNYASLVLGSAWELSVSAFAGSGGGILAVRVLDTAEIAGEIDVSARGYRGGLPGGRRAERIAGSVAQGGGGGGGGSGGHNATNVCGASGLGADGARSGYCGNVSSTAYSPCPATAATMCGTNGCGGAATGAGGGGGAGYGFAAATGGASPGLGGAGGNKVADAGQVGGTAMLPGFAGGGGSGGRDSGGGGGGGQPYDSFANESAPDLSRLVLGGGAAAGGGGGGGGGAGDFQCATGGSGGSAGGAGGARGTDNCGAADSTAGTAGTAGAAGGGAVLLHAADLRVTGAIRANGGAGGSGGPGGNGAAIGGCNTGRGAGGGGGGGGARGAAGGSVLLYGRTLDLGADLVRASGGAGGSGAGGGTAGTNAGAGGAGAGGSAGAAGVIAVRAIDEVIGTTIPPHAPLAE